MARSCKDKLLPRARALYAEGSPKPVIAEALKVSLRTVQQWARKDALSGHPWRRETEPVPATAAGRPAARSMGASPAEEICRKLEERLERLIEAGETAKDGARLEDRMLKICKVLEHLRAGRDEVGAQLSAMKRFAAFCLRTLSEEEMSPVRKAIRLFVENLKKEHS